MWAPRITVRIKLIIKYLKVKLCLYTHSGYTLYWSIVYALKPLVCGPWWWSLTFPKWIWNIIWDFNFKYFDKRNKFHRHAHTSLYFLLLTHISSKHISYNRILLISGIMVARLNVTDCIILQHIALLIAGFFFCKVSINIHGILTFAFVKWNNSLIPFSFFSLIHTLNNMHTKHYNRDIRKLVGTHRLYNN